jgi:hypothetical protein
MSWQSLAINEPLLLDVMSVRLGLNLQPITRIGNVFVQVLFGI